MANVREFIRQRGGTVSVANKLEIAASSVSTWIKRERIPLGQWSKFVDKGVATWGELSDLHQSASNTLESRAIA
jgi:hypothetical protein